MQTEVIVIAAWFGLSVLTVLIYAVGAQIGYRRGYEDGYDAGLSAPASDEAAGRRKRETG